MFTYVSLFDMNILPIARSLEREIMIKPNFCGNLQNNLVQLDLVTGVFLK